MTYTVEELEEVGQPIAMAVLLRIAEERRTITYGEMAKHFSAALKTRVSWMHVGNVVGAMMNSVIEVAPEVPPINALVINKTKKLPSYGADWYIKRYLPKVSYSKLNDKQKQVVLLPVYAAIYDFDNWVDVARKAFGKNLPALKKAPEGERDGKAKRLGFGGPAESEEHRRLKDYVATHPRKFGSPKGCVKGLTEEKIESWDEIDVLFMTTDELLAVEVKSRRSNNSDIRRGIFQCVKYRAVLEAQIAVTSAKPIIRARLVLESALTAHLDKLAKQLKIEVQVIKPLPAGSATP